MGNNKQGGPEESGSPGKAAFEAVAEASGAVLTEHVVASVALFVVCVALLVRKPKQWASVGRKLFRGSSDSDCSSDDESAGGGSAFRRPSPARSSVAAVDKRRGEMSREMPRRSMSSESLQQSFRGAAPCHSVVAEQLQMLIADDDNKSDSKYSDAELFEQSYRNSIRFAAYRRLVLPPTCKFVRPGRSNFRKHLLSGHGQRDTHSRSSTHDSLLGSLYPHHLFAFVVQFHSRIWNALLYRYRKIIGLPVDDEDDQDDSDDDATASHRPSMADQTLNNTNTNANASSTHHTSPTHDSKRASPTEKNHLSDSHLLDGDGDRRKSGSVDDATTNTSNSVTFAQNPVTEPDTVSDNAPLHIPPIVESDSGQLSVTGDDGTQSEKKTSSQGGNKKRKDALEPHRHRSSTTESNPGSPLGKSQEKHKSSPSSPEPFKSSSRTSLVESKSNALTKSKSMTSSSFTKKLDSPAPSDRKLSKSFLKKITSDLLTPDRHGYVLGEVFLNDPSNDSPLLAFVNSRAGAQQGLLLKAQLRRLLNPVQVWDLADGGPEKVLESFKVFKRLRLLVCGGDGTVSWIISAMEKLQLERWPPIAILPLGTGNDLARKHGWGGGYNNESLLLILQQVQDSYVSLLDRWQMAIVGKKGKVKETKDFTNYMSVGVDALSALQVHTLRESSPKLFFSRAMNKVWYAIAGAEDFIKASCADLPDYTVLVADGVKIPIPPDTQGIMVLNIDSYMGGVSLWSQGTKPRPMRERRHSEGELADVNTSWSSRHGLSNASLDRGETMDNADTEEKTKELSMQERFAKVTACENPSSCQDGMLDIVCVRGAFHLGQIRVGLNSAQLLCQCREVTITLKKKVAVQIDGEPWKQDKCKLKISRKNEPAVMLHRAAADGDGIEGEMVKLLDWAHEKKLIDHEVHTTMMKEFGRRVEKITHSKKDRTQDSLFFAMT